MKKQKRNTVKLSVLVDMLGDKDGMIRQKARKSLVTMAGLAVSSLTRALKHSESNQVRWEAAKALGSIIDARSIPTLVIALEDRDADVAWLAAEGLIKFKKAAWPVLLRALIKNGADSPVLRGGAHHVLQKQKDSEFGSLLKTLTTSLEYNTVPEMTLEAARSILKKMRKNDERLPAAGKTD